MLRLIGVFIFSIFVFPSFAQTEDDYYYVPENDSVASFKMKSGFYVSIKDMKNNTPIEPSQVFSTVEASNPDFFTEVLKKPSFRYLENDTMKSVSVDQLFGYAINDEVYLNVGNGEFFMMSTVGKICLIPVQTKPSVSPSFGVGASSWGGAGMGVGINISGGESKELILHTDLEKGKELSIESLKEFIADDPVLLEQFTAMKKRDQRKQLIIYIHKYNERHPVSFAP